MTTDQNTSIQTPSELAASHEIATGVAQFLTPVVRNLEALVVDGKHAHWHVRGGSFQAIHELLDDVVAHAQDYADTAAERIVALGLPVDSRIRVVADKTTLPELSAGFRSWEETTAAVIGLIDATLVSVREAVKGLDDIDLSSQDIAIAIEQGLTKDRWLLQAHLAS